MNIPLHLLETLAVFRTEKTLVRTAEALKTTQPTVSRRFIDLEGLSTIPIFEVRGRKKVLTDYGVALAQLASERLSGISVDMMNLANEYNRPDKHQLTVGGRTELLRSHFATVEFPGFMKLSPLTSKSAHIAIQQRAVDLIITQDNIETSFYSRKKFISEHWYVSVPRKFGSFSHLEKWNAHSENWPFASYDSSNRRLVEIANVIGFRRNPVARFEFADWETIKCRIESGLNWGILPEGFLPDESKAQNLRLEQVEPTTFFLYFKTNLRRQRWFMRWLEQTTVRLR